MDNENTAQQGLNPLPVNARPRKNAAATRFPPGVSGNPAGRGGGNRWSLLEWLTQLADRTVDELKEVVKDGKTPVNKLSAAVAWLRCAESENWQASHAELANLLNRFHGRATQNVHVEHSGLIVTQNITLAMLQQIPPSMPFGEAIEKLLPILESGGNVPQSLNSPEHPADSE